MRSAQLKVISIGAGVLLGGFLVFQLIANVFFQDNGAEVATTGGTVATGTLNTGKQQIVYVNDPYVDPLGEVDTAEVDSNVANIEAVPVDIAGVEPTIGVVPVDANATTPQTQVVETEVVVPITIWTDELYGKFELEREAFLTEMVIWEMAMDEIEDDVLMHYRDDIEDFVIYLSTFDVPRDAAYWSEGALTVWLKAYEDLKGTGERYEEVQEEIEEMEELFEELNERGNTFAVRMLERKISQLEEAREIENTFDREESVCEEGSENEGECLNVDYVLFKVDEAYEKEVLEDNWISDGEAEEGSIGVMKFMVEDYGTFNFFFWVEKVNDDGSIWVSAYNTGWNPLGHYVWLMSAEEAKYYAYMHFDDDYIEEHKVVEDEDGEESGEDEKEEGDEDVFDVCEVDVDDCF